MSPVDADEGDGAVARETNRWAKRVLEEGAELCLAHFARGHSELAMAACGASVPLDANIVGRIEKRSVDARPVADDPLQEFGIPAVATPHTVSSENPDVAWLRSRRCGNRRDDLIIRVDS